MEEIWKDIKGYEGLYKISNYGRVESLPKNRYGSKKSIILKPFLDKDGYLNIGLCKNNVVTKHKVHRLVAQVFINNCHNKPQVNHKNGIKDDNRVTNLEWVTNGENQKHAWKYGLKINTERLRTQARINGKQA